MFSNNLIRLFILFLLFSCAVQRPPSGGPVDRIPPDIVSSNPLPGVLNVPTTLNQLKIIFSERMKQSTIRNNLFVSPPLKFKNRWEKGRILIIDLVDTLKPQRTYVLSVGSGLQDMHNNKMAHSFTLAFSTGDTIDQGKISGRIYGLKRSETFYIFAYLLNDSTLFNPFKNKPDYVTLTGDNGDYTLGYLKNGKYRVMGVEDRNHNLLLDAIMERFALSFRDVALHDSLNRFRGLDMQLAKLDTIPPMLTAARARYQNLLVLRFSEPLALDSLTRISIADSLTNQPLSIKTLAKAPKHDSWLELITAPMDSNRIYRVKCLNLADSSHNRNPDTLITYFMGTVKKDTSTFKLLRHLPKDSAKNVRPESSVFFEFNQPVNWQQVKANYHLQTKMGKTMSGFWQIKNLYQAGFHPYNPLQPDHTYRSVLNFKPIKSYFGKTAKDSISSHVFTIISQKELGEISGTIQPAINLKHPLILNVRSVRGKQFHKSLTIRKKHSFKFDYLPEGSYKIDGFIDLNENGKLDHGSLLPFKFCEPFKFLPDTVKVRKRWETSGIIFTLPPITEPTK